MPSGANVAARLQRRIQDSAHTLTVVFPAARVASTGSVPGAAPASPLGGPAPTQTVVTPNPTRVRSDVSVQCLWLDAAQLGDLQRHEVEKFAGAWRADADAVARVIPADVADGVGTYFDTCDYVEHAGRRFIVLQVVPMGPSFAEAHSYSVWLRGTTNQ